MNERLHDQIPEPDGGVPSILTLEHSKAKDLSGSIPAYVAEAAEKVLTRSEWKNMPGRGSALYVKLEDSSVLAGKVFHPETWVRQNDTVIDLEAGQSLHSRSDKRRFRAAIIEIGEDYDPYQLYLLTEKIIPRLRISKGNSELREELEYMPAGIERDRAIDKTIAKAAPVFVIAPAGQKEEIYWVLWANKNLFAVNAVEKSLRGEKHTVAESRIRKKSDMPHRNLRETSRKKDYDYLTIGLTRIARSIKTLDPRIKAVSFHSDYLGKNSIESRLEHTNNYLRDIKSAFAAVGAEFEYTCGCRFARYREKGNIYTDKLGACPSGVEITTDELPDTELLKSFTESGSAEQSFEKILNRYEDEINKYMGRDKQPMIVEISKKESEYMCPDNCGNHAIKLTLAGRNYNGFSVINNLICPQTRKILSKTRTNLSTDKFLAEYGQK